jgi:outer membrane receptor protein involved in Fe transport
VFGNVQVPLSDQITVYGGLRYTSVKKDYIGCGYDGGDGTWAAASKLIQDLLADIYEYTPAGVDVGPFGCGTTGPAPTYNPLPAGFPDELNEDNVSFRAGIDFKPVQDTLLYANVSRGYKAGVFPTVASQFLRSAGTGAAGTAYRL